MVQLPAPLQVGVDLMYQGIVQQAGLFPTTADQDAEKLVSFKKFSHQGTIHKRLLGGPDAEKFNHKHICTPLFWPQKFQGPFFDMKIMYQSRRKLYKLNFPRKICGIFFHPPLGGSKRLRPPFLHQAP